MPLRRGSDRATISSNIREMSDAGYPQKQAVAAAMRTADADDNSMPRPAVNRKKMLRDMRRRMLDRVG